MIKDVFFDLDHTLWDFEKNSALAFESVFKMRNLNVNMTDFLSFYVAINREYWERFRKDLITSNELRYGRLKDTFDKINYKMSDDLINQLAIDYIEVLPKNNHLINGAIEILVYLKPKYNLHIITNGFATIQDNKLNNSGILSYFKTITNSETVGVKKPNPIIFQSALHLAKAKKETSIMIGDCIEADVQGALDFGMDAIFFNENKHKVSDSINQISHLSELIKYL